MTGEVRYEVRGPAAWLTIDREERRNPLSPGVILGLVEALGHAARDDAVRVVVLTGAGERAFSAGGDLSDIQTRGELPAEARFEAYMQVMKEAHDVVYTLVNCDKVVISAINGVAVGAGLAVALLADISVMAEDARLTDGHTRLGVAAGDHAAMVWPLLCGMAKAKYYLLTCDFIDGREAERIGLVSKAVPREQVLPEAMAIAHRLADGAQPALRFTKRALNQWLRLGGLTAFDYSLAVEMLGFFGADVAAGVKGIVEKRAPEYPSARG